MLIFTHTHTIKSNKYLHNTLNKNKRKLYNTRIKKYVGLVGRWVYLYNSKNKEEEWIK